MLDSTVPADTAGTPNDPADTVMHLALVGRPHLSVCGEVAANVPITALPRKATCPQCAPTAPAAERVASNRAFLARYGNDPTVALDYIGQALIDAAAAGPLAPDVAAALAMYEAYVEATGGVR